MYLNPARQRGSLAITLTEMFDFNTPVRLLADDFGYDKD
jgi:hypothetical protein